MGTSHSTHRQYFENRNRIHGYEKSTNKKARSLTASHQTKNQLRYSNKVGNSSKESDGINGSKNKNRNKVVYYSQDDVEMAGQILQKIRNYQKKFINSKQKVEKSRSQTKLPSYSSQNLLPSNPQYIIKVNKDTNHNEVAIIQDIPSNNSIIDFDSNMPQASSPKNSDRNLFQGKFNRNRYQNGNHHLYDSVKVNGNYIKNSEVNNNFSSETQHKIKNNEQISQIIQEYYKNYESTSNSELAKKFGLKSNAKNDGRAVYLKYQGPYGNQHGSIY